MSDASQSDITPLTVGETTEALERRGHLVTTGAVASMYRVGLPSEESSPTVFKVEFPPDCRIEPHTHACDYSEIILEGSQQVSGQWLHKGDVRIGLANRGYGPLIAGPEGATVLVIFADGRWRGIPKGAQSDGSTLGTDQIAERFTSDESLI
jgi:quercetin dioxygenase-like cupin family protein